MKMLKSICAYAFAVLLFGYVLIGVGISTFNELDSDLRSLAWPYYIYKQRSIDNSGVHFGNAIESCNRAVDVMNAQSSLSPVSDSDRETIKISLRRALSEGRMVDNAILEEACPNAGEHFRKEFISGMEKIIDGIERSDSQTVESGNVLLKRWCIWYRDHMCRNQSRHSE